MATAREKPIKWFIGKLQCYIFLSTIVRRGRRRGKKGRLEKKKGPALVCMEILGWDSVEKNNANV